MSKLATKNTLFEHFWASILKKYCQILNQHPQICLTVKFGKEKPRMSKFGTKNVFLHTWGFLG